MILATDLNLVTDSLMIKEQKQKDEMEIVYFVMHVVDFKKGSQRQCLIGKIVTNR